MTIAVYIGLCLIIALIGYNRKFGFWGYFFCSVALTPCIGAVVLLASDKRPKQQKECPQGSKPLSEVKTGPL
jgi:hypothetical protein